MRLFPVAIITGATRGIGNEITKHLSKKGLSCICIGSSKESISKIELDRHLLYVHEHQRHGALAIDLSNWPTSLGSQSIESLSFKLENNKLSKEPLKSESIFSLIDKWNNNTAEKKDICYYTSLLVNCAGITQEKISIKESNDVIQKIMNTNFMSVVNLCNLTILRMMKEKRKVSNHPDIKRKIINISSILGNSNIILPGTSIYSASKSALTTYTNVLNKEIERTGITVSNLEPSLIKDTDMIKHLSDDSMLKNLSNLELQPESKETIANKVLQIYSS